MAYLLKFLDIFRWKKHYGREWGIQKIFMDFIKERMNRIMSKVYIFFADGFEDIEGLTVVDLMRRAGIDIQTVSIKETKEIRTSHGIDLLTDRTFGECDFSDADMLVILTSVDKVCLNYGKEDEIKLDTLSLADAKKYLAAGEFGEGTMAPKIEAAIDFIGESAIRSVLVTKLNKEAGEITGGMGTLIKK